MPCIMAVITLLFWLLCVVVAVSAGDPEFRDFEPLAFTASDFTASTLADCLGYNASNVKTGTSTLTADLTLAGPACNIYGTDLKSLRLEVTYETVDRIHVKIADIANQVYQVPEDVLPRPPSKGATRGNSNIVFNYIAAPFSFSISRAKGGEVLFDTSAASIIFESQYLRLRTKLPKDPNIYGLGEHSDPLRLPTTNYIRTLWSQDSYGLPAGANLYGNHPVYYEHRQTGSHGVFFLNSNGMDIKLSNTNGNDQYLEYNTLGGVFDFYFMAGPTPIAVAQQYAEVVGLAAMMPYWSLGFHNCRYGYQDAFAAAEAIYNYSKAAIPLETMWLDIDYMDRRRVFTVDPDRFPISKMKAINDYLHAHHQKEIVMVDPAVAYASDYEPYQRGVDQNIWLKRSNGSSWLGVVWPGVTAFPDWFSSNIQSYWNGEFSKFFTASGGVDIDGLWIDMNEPSNFPCYFPCDNPFRSAIGFPPTPPPIRPNPRPLPGFPCDFQPPGTSCMASKAQKKSVSQPQQVQSVQIRQTAGKGIGLPGRDLLYPKYAIHNKAAWNTASNAAGGGISNKTVNTNIMHQNGLAMYDTHNLYGTMMSTISAKAMLNRRPTERPFVITRSTFAGAGAKVGKWLGDNISNWPGYRCSIRELLAFTSIYQMPMVGSDVCGHGGDATEQLCTRWAALGAFSPFYRNHNSLDSTPQEFYRWPSTAEAARKAMGIRYRLLDYIYTALYHQTIDGTPLLNPYFYLYPNDPNTYRIELQYFYGPGLLVSPVAQENSNSTSAYFAKDTFYDYYTHAVVKGTGAYTTITNVDWTKIPLHYKGGVIFPQRVSGAQTTTSLRTKDFEIIVAIGKDGKAAGELYLDDGISLVQTKTSYLKFLFDGGKLTVDGTFGYNPGVSIRRILFLGVIEKPSAYTVDGKTTTTWSYDASVGQVVVQLQKPLTKGFTVATVRSAAANGNKQVQTSSVATVRSVMVDDNEQIQKPLTAA